MSVLTDTLLNVTTLCASQKQKHIVSVLLCLAYSIWLNAHWCSVYNLTPFEEWITTPCVCTHILCVLLSASRHLGDIYLLAIVNTNIFFHMALGFHPFHSFMCMFRSEVIGSCCNPAFNFWRNGWVVLHTVYAFLQFCQQCTRAFLPALY